MRKLIGVVIFILSVASYAKDVCTDNGGKIINATQQKSIVRVCIFKKSGAVIGYNNLVTNPSHQSAAAAAFINKSVVGTHSDDPCAEIDAKLGGIQTETMPIPVCTFSDGSLIDPGTLVEGPDYAKDLAKALAGD